MKAVFYTVTIAVTAFKLYLDRRQFAALRSKPLAQIVSNVVTKEEEKKTRSYNATLLKVNVLTLLVMLVKDLLLLQVIADLFRFSRSVIEWAALDPLNEVYTSVVFMVLYRACTQFAMLPIQLYETFVIDKEIGKTTSTVNKFLTTFAINLAISSVFVGVAVAGMVAILTNFDEKRAALYMSLFACAIYIVYQILAVPLIIPLIYKLGPMKESVLRTEIEQMAKEQGIPVNRIMVVHLSDTTTGSAAQFLGLPFAGKTILLSDTLENHLSVDEIKAILSHEIGHWKYNHILVQLAVAMITVFVTFELFETLRHFDPMYLAFGVPQSADGSYAVVVGFVLFTYLNHPIYTFLSWCHVYSTRVCEIQADRYALGIFSKDILKSATVAEFKHNTANIVFDRWYSVFYNEHPSFEERLEMIDKYEAK